MQKLGKGLSPCGWLPQSEGDWRALHGAYWERGAFPLKHLLPPPWAKTSNSHPAHYGGFFSGVSAAPCRTLATQQLEGSEIIIWIMSSKASNFKDNKCKLLPVAQHALYHRTPTTSYHVPPHPICCSPGAIPQTCQTHSGPGPFARGVLSAWDALLPDFQMTDICLSSWASSNVTSLMGLSLGT